MLENQRRAPPEMPTQEATGQPGTPRAPDTRARAMAALAPSVPLPKEGSIPKPGYLITSKRGTKVTELVLTEMNYSFQE